MNHLLINAITIDLEDYFQVYNFSKVIRFSDWDKYQCRIERNTFTVLEILGKFNVKATFFVLGWIAERYPELIKIIHQEGHEIASHGYCHKLINSQTRERFREDIRKTKKILEDIIGINVMGFRAPTFSISHKISWAFETLIEEDFKYDSSILPIFGNYSKSIDIPRFPFVIKSNASNVLADHNISRKQYTCYFNIHHSSFTNEKSIIEFPISTIRICSKNFPIAGGGYFRLFPYCFIKWGFNRINHRERKPFIFYIHPWEFDFNQPRIRGISNLSRFRHYINIKKTEDKVKRLLTDFRFSSVKTVLGM